MATVMMVGPFADTLRNFRENLLREMVRRGHRVIACAPDVSQQIQEQLSAFGVQYQNIPLDRAGINPFHDLHSIRAMKALFRNYAPDAVFFYNIKPVIYGSIAAHLAKVPRIGSMITGLGNTFACDTLKRKVLNLLVRRLYKFALGKNCRIFFQNPDDRGLFEAYGLVQADERVVMVRGSGVDLQYFSQQPVPASVSFILISRLIREKGIQEYLAAAQTIKRKYPQAVFRLAGWIDQQQHSVCRQEIEAFEQEGIIEFLGKLADVRPAVTETAVYVLPSYYREGIPRTLLESMAMGRALITTDSPGCRETVQDGVNGFMIPPRDVSALVQAMEKFIVEPELASRMGAASREMAEAQFDEAQVNRLILDHLLP